jgi:hypothetical protein
MWSGSSGRRPAPSRSLLGDCENGSTLPNGSNGDRPSIEAGPRRSAGGGPRSEAAGLQQLITNPNVIEILRDDSPERER